MKELTFLEKLIVLYENIIDHPLFILLFLVPIVLLFLRKKHGKKIFIIAYFLVIFVLLISFGDIIFKLFDNLMDGLFMFLYFPNFITLFIVVIACSLIALISLFGKKINVVSKTINYLSFGIVQSLFSLILITVRVNKINIYKDNALYTDKDVLTLMQLLIGTFSIQVLSIIIIKMINKATNVLDNKANISSKVKAEINNLSKTKIRTVNIDNNRVGYINVADKSLTSKPILKPFKFDINKLESIHFSDYLFSSDKGIDNYNDIISKKLFNKVSINYDKDFSIDVPASLYNSFKLSDKDFYYLNEIIKKRKFKPVILDSNKIVYLRLINRGFKRIILENKNVSYLNEIISKRKFKPIIIDSNKIINLNVPNKSFKIFTLGNKQFSYLNNDMSNRKYSSVSLDLNKKALINMPKKDYNISSIDLNKDVSINVPGKMYNRVSLKDKTFNLLNGVTNKNVKPVKLDSNKVYNTVNSDEYKNKDSDYLKERKYPDFSMKTAEPDIAFNSKPDLFKPMKNKFISESDKKVILPVMSFPKKDISYRIIDNLQIIDIQSTLDTVVKCHLMKNVIVKSYEKMSVSNLEICNFKLLSDIIKVYKLIRK